MNWIDETKKYAHDYRGMAMSEEELEQMLMTYGGFVHAQGTQEALAKVEEWVKENKLDNVWVQDLSPMGGIMCRECGCQEGCECATYNEALEKVLHHLQQLKDTKTV